MNLYESLEIEKSVKSRFEIRITLHGRFIFIHLNERFTKPNETSLYAVRTLINCTRPGGYGKFIVT